MDLEEWELLPTDGFIDLHEDGGNSFSSSSANTKDSVIDMNYIQNLIDPPKKKKISSSRDVPVVPIRFDHQETEEKIPVEEKEIPEDQPNNPPKKLGVSESLHDSETISQVFFKKLKENEFADMKVDSPKSVNRGFLPQVDVGAYQFEEKDGNFEKDQDFRREKTPKLNEDGTAWEKDGDHGVVDDESNGGLNLWKWAMTGVGALFSFGVAAATVSLIILGSRQKEKHSHKSPTELHFQIYAHEKRIKQVVHHATKLNEAISAVRGAPLTRAHITIGGYCDGL